jgi:hypothetical protein
MKTEELKATLQWTEVDEIPILKLWQDPSQYPQTVVMTVSHAEYLKFSKDPNGFMKFVNEHDVFSKPVIFAGPWVSLSSLEQEGGPSEWVLTLGHGHRSTLTVAALQKLKDEDENSKWVSYTHGGALSKVA